MLEKILQQSGTVFTAKTTIDFDFDVIEEHLYRRNGKHYLFIDHWSEEDKCSYKSVKEISEESAYFTYAEANMADNYRLLNEEDFADRLEDSIDFYVSKAA